MDDFGFDDISNVLDDLANFDVGDLTQQPVAPAPVQTPVQVQPSLAPQAVSVAHQVPVAQAPSAPVEQYQAIDDLGMDGLGMDDLGMDGLGVDELQLQPLEELEISDASLGLDFELSTDLELQPLEMEPMSVEPMQVQPMNVQPMNVQPMNVQPMNVQPMNVQPMNVQPMNVQPMNVQPMNVQPMNVQPMNVQPMNVQPMNVQPMNMAPVNAATHAVNASRVQTVEVQPMNARAAQPLQARSFEVQPMNVQPMNVQPMNVQPMNAVSVEPMTSARGPVKQRDIADVDQTSSAFTYTAGDVEDEEWPDPVKHDIEARPLTDGMDKMVLTLVLADKSTKKVFVTADFTCHEVLLLFASKLHMWQVEFFNLAVDNKEEDADRWLSPEKTLLEEGITGNSEVQMKIKYFKTPKKIVDDAAIRLFYLQVKQNIISAQCPCSEKVAVRLAAMQVQLSYGNYAPSKHHKGFLADAIRDFLPREIVADNEIDYLEARIFNLHKTLVGKENGEVMQSYLDLAQQIQTYGASIYLVKEKFGRTKRFAVAEDGILISTDENPKQFKFYSFKNLGAWRQTADGFTVETMEPKEELEFQTTEFKAGQIIELLSGYYVFLLGVDPGELPLVRLPMKPQGLPNAKMFHKPNTALKRNLSDQQFSRLELFKSEFVKESKRNNITINIDVLLQIDDALDQDLVLDALNISDCGMGPAALFAFSSALSTAFDYRPKSGEEFFEENLTLAKLDLSDNPLLRGSEGIDALGTLFCIEGHQLKKVKLRNVGLTGKTAAGMNTYLAKNQFLESLDLEGNELKKKGAVAFLKALKGQERCGAFNLSGTGQAQEICFFMAQVLAKNQNVVELRLANNKVDDKGLANLMKGFIRNRSLTILDLSHCSFGTTGGKTIIKWLEEHRNLRQLYLSGNNLGTAWGSSLVKLLKAGSPLNALGIAGTGIGAKGTRGVLEAVKETHSIRELQISSNPIDKKGGQVLNECISSRAVNLRRLEITKCALDKRMLAAMGQSLQQNTTLHYFDVSGNDMKDVETGKSWGDAVKTNQSLLELLLRACSFSNDSFEAFCAGLAKNKALTRLDLSTNKNIGKNGLGHLAAALAGNETLEVLTLKSIGADAAAFTGFLRALEGKNFILKTVDARGNSGLAKTNWASALKNIPFKVLM